MLAISNSVGTVCNRADARKFGAECKAKTNCALIAQFQTAPTGPGGNKYYRINKLIFIQFALQSIQKVARLDTQTL